MSHLVIRERADADPRHFDVEEFDIDDDGHTLLWAPKARLAGVFFPGAVHELHFAEIEMPAPVQAHGAQAA